MGRNHHSIWYIGIHIESLVEEKSSRGLIRYTGKNSKTENITRSIESVCYREPGRVPNGDSGVLWLQSAGNLQGFETQWDYAQKKTKRYQEQDSEKVAEYLQTIAGVSKDRIAYVDETGIDTYLYREHCYAEKGRQVIGYIRGRKYRRVSIVAAKMGKKVIAPLQYEGTMDSVLFETWFQSCLLQALPDASVIVMDNAAFHRKIKLFALAELAGLTLIFLPPYSPDLNPIENFWAWLKNRLRKTLSDYGDFDDALYSVFQFV